MLPAKGARALLGIKGSESLLEEETTGLRMIRTGSIPFIYGTEIGRLTLRTTDSLTKMKTATSGELTGASGLFSKISNVKDKIKSALGLPTNPIPTFVVDTLREKYRDALGNVQQRIEQLGEVKSSASGTGLGRFLAKNASGGNLSAVGKNLVGGALKEGKKALAQKVFGQRGGSSLGLAQGNVPSGITPKPSNQLTTQFTDVVVRPTQRQINNATRIIIYRDNLSLINTRCPITMEDFVNGDRICMIRQCRHCFRESAIMGWFQSSVRCPVCRYDIRETSLPDISHNIVRPVDDTENNIDDNTVNLLSRQIRNLLIQSIDNQITTDVSRNNTLVFDIPIMFTTRREVTEEELEDDDIE